jgi:pyruvate dehydrogenase E1 component subunit beta
MTLTTPATPTTPAATRLTYREAMRAAIRDALQRDERVFLMGEDVGRYGGCFAVSKGLLDEFGPERIRDTPLSESAFVGAGIGAALAGMRPIVEIMTVNFSLLALDQIMNNAATLQHMSGGQLHVPLVIRMTTGAGRQLAAQHSHSLEGWYAHIPGIKVLVPGTVADARDMLWPALEDPDPVLIFEHGALYGTEDDLTPEVAPVDISHAQIRRAGGDVSVITYGGSLPKCLAAAEELAAAGIEAEVIDLRTLRPLDDDTVMASVTRTHRAVIVDEGWRTGSISAEISARIMEHAFYDLDAPVARVCSAEVPMPYAKHLEEAALPQADRIAAAVREVTARG